MDYQGIGMLLTVVAMMITFIVVIMKRSKTSNKNASLVPEIEMKEA